MKKLADWLDAKPGMATRIKKLLNFNATNVSNWRNGHKPIPWVHMPLLEELSEGLISVQEMMDYRIANFPRKPAST